MFACPGSCEIKLHARNWLYNISIQIILHWTWIPQGNGHFCIGQCRRAQATISRLQGSASFDLLSVPKPGWTEFQPTCALAWLVWPKWNWSIHPLGIPIAYCDLLIWHNMYIILIHFISQWITIRVTIKNISKTSSQDEPNAFVSLCFCHHCCHPRPLPWRIRRMFHQLFLRARWNFWPSSWSSCSGLLGARGCRGCEKNMAAHGEHDDKLNQKRNTIGFELEFLGHPYC